MNVSQLTHRYSAGTPFEHLALDAVDLDIYEGEYLGIIGQTGSGKSTLIQHLNGLLKPTAGRILFEGEDIWSKASLTRRLRFQVGLVFQYPEYQLFEETVYKDIAFGPSNMQLTEAEIDRRVHRAIEFVELSPELLSRSPFELSGGQKRRVAIAGVIAMEPRILVLDEPTAGLDPGSVASLLQNIKDYHKKNRATVVVVTHSMEQIAQMADRLVVFHQGKIPMSGTPRAVFSHGAELMAMGLGVPQLSRVFTRLAARGAAVDPSVYTLEEAKASFLSAHARKGES